MKEYLLNTHSQTPVIFDALREKKSHLFFTILFTTFFSSNVMNIFKHKEALIVEKNFSVNTHMPTTYILQLLTFALFYI